MSEIKKIRVLCVEDEEDIRKNISEILRDEGFEVFEAKNGKSGFESFVKNKPDLILSDVMMPELDGYGLLEMVRKSKNTVNKTVPFIFLTALGQKDKILKGVSLLANDYLLKPIDFDLMIAKIREKTVNALQIRENYDLGIKNIKDQIAVILPSEIFSYLDVISHVSSNMKSEPYGPFPHRCYLEDLNKIYISSIKLRAAVTNSLDENVIDHKLNADEEVFTISSFLQNLISGLDLKFKSQVHFEEHPENKALPQLKIDRLILTVALEEVFAEVFKFDPEYKIDITVMIDHQNQMAIILYFSSRVKKINLKNILNETKISQTLYKQNCRLEIRDDKQSNLVILVPSHHLVN
jgi:CheY-like chemotaxis protein